MKFFILLSLLLSNLAFADLKSEIKKVVDDFGCMKQIKMSLEGDSINGYLMAGDGRVRMIAPSLRTTVAKFSINDNSYDLKKEQTNFTITYSLKNEKDGKISTEVLKLSFREDLRFGEYISKIGLGYSEDDEEPILVEALLL